MRWLLYCLIALLGCQTSYPYESATVPPPPRLAKLPVPPGECTAHCVAIVRAQNLASMIERKEALLKIASIPDLNLHEQLHLVNVALSLEMFGWDEVFLELAQHRYLRYTTKDYLFHYANRLSYVHQTRVVELLHQNPGVPDELTDMEKLWCRYFGLNEYEILDYYRAKFTGADILLIFYIAHYSGKYPEAIGEWRKRDLTWREIAFGKLDLDTGLFFDELPLDKPIPAPFNRPYELYRIWSERGTKKQWLRLTDEEMVQLVQLKVVHTYYDIPVLEIMQTIAAGKDFSEVIKGRQRQPKKT
jgi:hypothetical protein